MSYHETYEFFAIDRCLTPAEVRTLRAISTRATITPARFYNFYDWGGLKGDPRKMLQRYFDLFVYTGNGLAEWGMLRFPSDRIDLRRWRPYLVEQRGARTPARAASVATEGDVAILTITPAEDVTLGPIARGSLEDFDEFEDEDFEDAGDSWREDRIDEESADRPAARRSEGDFKCVPGGHSAPDGTARARRRPRSRSGVRDATPRVARQPREQDSVPTAGARGRTDWGATRTDRRHPCHAAGAK